MSHEFVNTVLDVLSGVQSYGGAQVVRANPCADLPPTQLSPFRDKK